VTKIFLKLDLENLNFRFMLQKFPKNVAIFATFFIFLLQQF